MSLAFTIIRCDGPNGVEGRRCAALLTIPGTRDVKQALADMGWSTHTTGTHHCWGCSTAPSPLAILAEITL